MGLFQSLTFWLPTPVFWLIIGVLMLGLEMINRRLVYFLPGSLAAITLAILLLLLPAQTRFWPLIPIPGVDQIIAWIAMTVITTPIFMKVKRLGRKRRHRRRLSRP